MCVINLSTLKLRQEKKWRSCSTYAISKGSYLTAHAQSDLSLCCSPTKYKHLAKHRMARVPLYCLCMRWAVFLPYDIQIHCSMNSIYMSRTMWKRLSSHTWTAESRWASVRPHIHVLFNVGLQNHWMRQYLSTYSNSKVSDEHVRLYNHKERRVVYVNIIVTFSASHTYNWNTVKYFTYIVLRQTLKIHIIGVASRTLLTYNWNSL